MNEKWNDTLNEISDAYLEEAIHPQKRRVIPWPQAIAGTVAAAMLLLLLTPFSPLRMDGAAKAPESNAPALDYPTREDSNLPPGDNTPAQPSVPVVMPLSGVIAAPEYPTMAPYPEVPEAYPDTPEIIAWKASLTQQYSQAKGYANNLKGFFKAAIPQFLSNPEGNAVCSPVNIYMALAMLAETAGGDSRQAVLDALNAESMDALRSQAYQVWNAHYRADGAADTWLANSLWLNEGWGYRADTVDTLADHYFATVFQGQFGSEEMDASLRGWLNNNTRGMLNNDSQGVSLNPDDALALASTVYFSARWDGVFSQLKNTQGLFHTPAGDVETTFMNRTLAYGPYYYGEDFGAVRLGFDDAGARGYGAMWLILPDEGYDPQDLLASGHALDMIMKPQLQQTRAEVKVHLSVPKFDVSAETDLRPGLTALGLGELFDPAAADFSGILEHAEGVYLGGARHAARVTIDEEGVTAAAYTLMLYAGSPMPPEEEVYFTLDRPFLFVITSRDNLPLFVGVVTEP